MAKKYTKTSSGYIRRSNPTVTDNGNIYENDILTFGEQYDEINSETITITDGNFTFVTRLKDDVKKTYNNGEFSEAYTLEDVILYKDENNIDVDITKEIEKEKTYINLKTDVKNLRYFSYFGSTVELIRSSVEDIINNFPAALYIKNITNVIGSGTKNITIPLTSISNPFSIDILNYTTDRGSLEYNLRIFASSFKDYNISDVNITGFTNDGTNIILNLAANANVTDSFYIKPNKGKIDLFFNNLNDFQNTLLNVKTFPKYKTTILIPTDSEQGVVNKYREFIWPTIDGYNLDVESVDYQLFLNDIIDSATFIDENYTDNIYRMLTHDVIKNMDYSYSITDNVDDLEDIEIGTTKIQKLLRLYGRNFDETKKYAENISFVNNITYDNKNNIPDKFLKTKLNISGWETNNLSNTFLKTDTTSINLFPTISDSYSLNQVEKELQKRFILSSKQILRSKGTRKAIRNLFGLLGVDEDLYEIREYIQKVDEFISGQTLQNIIQANTNFVGGEMEGIVYQNKNDNNEIMLNGLNIGLFVKCPICGNDEYVKTYSPNLLQNSAYPSFGSNNIPSDVSTLRTDEIDKYQRATPGVGKSVSLWGAQFNYIETDVNYVVSLMIRLQGTTGQFGKAYLYVNTDVNDSAYMNENIPFNTWTRVRTNPFKLPLETIPNPSFLIIGNESNNKIGTYLDYKKVKIEKNTTSTPWSEYGDNYIEYGICTNDDIGFDLTGNTYGYPKPKPNTNDFYFQQKGRWLKETGGINTDYTGNTYVSENTIGNNPHIGDSYYDNGYDYIDQFKQLFKQRLRNEGNYPTFNLLDYINYGFNITSKKEIENTKISLIENDLNKKILNIKNFVIGIDCEKILQDYILNNSEYDNTITSDSIFNYIKELTLPYIEQIVPSTSIFDFVKIDKNTPKWLLVDRYCDRDENQNFNGDLYVKYKNINYFDETSTGYNTLIEILEKDFGDNYEFVISNNFTGFEHEVTFKIIGYEGCEKEESANWVVDDFIFGNI